MKKLSLKLNDVFRSVQGEGHLVGYDTLFIRTQGCSVGCKWCDTKQSWANPGKLKSAKKKNLSYGLIDLYNKIKREVSSDTWITFTGGEPLEQIDSIIWLMAKLQKNDYENLSLETSGVIRYDAKKKVFVLPDKKMIIDLNVLNIFLSVSPKLKSALGNRFSFDVLSKICDLWFDNTDRSFRLQFKFVISSIEDLLIIEKLCSVNSYIEENHFFLQLEQSKLSDKKLIKEIILFIQKHPKIRFTIQQHSILKLK